MSCKKSGINIIAPLFLLLALVVYAFSTGFINGVHLLGDILNIFGSLFVAILNLIWNIPIIGQKIIKNAITTIIILVIWGKYETDNKILKFAVGGGVSLICLLLTWSNLI